MNKEKKERIKKVKALSNKELRHIMGGVVKDSPPPSSTIQKNKFY